MTRRQFLTVTALSPVAQVVAAEDYDFVAFGEAARHLHATAVLYAR